MFKAILDTLFRPFGVKAEVHVQYSTKALEMLKHHLKIGSNADAIPNSAVKLYWSEGKLTHIKPNGVNRPAYYVLNANRADATVEDFEDLAQQVQDYILFRTDYVMYVYHCGKVQHVKPKWYVPITNTWTRLPCDLLYNAG